MSAVRLTSDTAFVAPSGGSLRDKEDEMIRPLWHVVGGEVRVAVDEAEWWAVLVAAIHHPEVLATCQPETDPSEAQEVLAEVCEFYTAASMAHGQFQDDDVADPVGDERVLRDGDEMVFSPGGELANLAMCLELRGLGGEGSYRLRGVGLVRGHRQGVGNAGVRAKSKR